MDQQTALILIVVNLLAAVVIIIWYLFDRYTKPEPSVKDKNMWLYPFLVGAMLGVIGSALLFLHTVGWF